MNSKVFLFLFFIALFSCNSSKESDSSLSTQYGSPKALLAHLEKDQITWWSYHKREIILSSEFNPLGLDGSSISKDEFLKQLSTGDFMALKVTDEREKDFYQLYRLRPTTHPSISEMIQIDLQGAYDFYLREGRPFPKFSFTDLTGNTFSSENTQGKTVILKTWFIGCKPCIEEMPSLNEMVARYQHRDDIVFVSLALDKPDALEKFLAKTEFDYAVVPEQKEFIFKKLNSQAFPTHFIINGEVNIIKVVSSFRELELALAEQEI